MKSLILYTLPESAREFERFAIENCGHSVVMKQVTFTQDSEVEYRISAKVAHWLRIEVRKEKIDAVIWVSHACPGKLSPKGAHGVENPLPNAAINLEDVVQLLVIANPMVVTFACPKFGKIRKSDQLKPYAVRNGAKFIADEVANHTPNNGRQLIVNASSTDNTIATNSSLFHLMALDNHYLVNEGQVYELSERKVESPPRMLVFAEEDMDAGFDFVPGEALSYDY